MFNFFHDEIFTDASTISPIKDVSNTSTARTTTKLEAKTNNTAKVSTTICSMTIGSTLETTLSSKTTDKSTTPSTKFVEDKSNTNLIRFNNNLIRIEIFFLGHSK